VGGSLLRRGPLPSEATGLGGYGLFTLASVKDGAWQPAKTTLFAGGNGADVRKSAVGDFCQSAMAASSFRR
jgi:hypothetical protein